MLQLRCSYASRRRDICESISFVVGEGDGYSTLCADMSLIHRRLSDALFFFRASMCNETKHCITNAYNLKNMHLVVHIKKNDLCYEFQNSKISVVISLQWNFRLFRHRFPSSKYEINIAFLFSQSPIDTVMHTHAAPCAFSIPPLRALWSLRRPCATSPPNTQRILCTHASRRSTYVRTL